MSFANVIGQERAKRIIGRALSRDRLPHALLLYGPEGVGKKALAFEIAKALNCSASSVEACDRCHACRRVASMQHPDLSVVFPVSPGKREDADEDAALEGDDAELLLQIARDPYSPVPLGRNANIPVERVRMLRREASYKVSEGKRKVAIILEADRMRPEGANALLKTLEEPPGDLVLILTTARPDGLLPTIRSRCQRLCVGPLGIRDVARELGRRRGVSAERAEALARLAGGSLGRALGLVDTDLDERRTAAYELLRLALYGEEAALLEQVEAWVARRDRILVEQILEMLIVWLRDLLLWEQGYRTPIINFDRTDELDKLAGHFDLRGLERSIEEVDVCFEMMSRNVNPQLVLLGLGFGLRRITRR